MLEESTKIALNEKFGIDIDDYDEQTQKDILRQSISRNDEIIAINFEKAALFEEIIRDITNHLNGGGKSATK